MPIVYSQTVDGGKRGSSTPINSRRRYIPASIKVVGSEHAAAKNNSGSDPLLKEEHQYRFITPLLAASESGSLRYSVRRESGDVLIVEENQETDTAIFASNFPDGLQVQISVAPAQ